MREYGVDLVNDLGTPRLSWRRLGILIRQLPPGSSLHREMYPEHAGWSITDYLLAEIIDLLAAANWQRGNAGAKTPTPKPKPMWRPPPAGTETRRRSFDDRVRDWKRRHIDGR